jgi:hypothetical protein
MSAESTKRPALTISFRLKDDSERNILLTKAKQTSTNVTDFLRGCIFENDNTRGHADGDLVKGLADDIIFMFKFFQKNAKNLDITGQEKERFIAILRKAKEMAQHEP